MFFAHYPSLTKHFIRVAIFPLPSTSAAAPPPPTPTAAIASELLYSEIRFDLNRPILISSLFLFIHRDFFYDFAIFFIFCVIFMLYMFSCLIIFWIGYWWEWNDQQGNIKKKRKEKNWTISTTLSFGYIYKTW